MHPDNNCSCLKLCSFKKICSLSVCACFHYCVRYACMRACMHACTHVRIVAGLPAGVNPAHARTHAGTAQGLSTIQIFISCRHRIISQRHLLCSCSMISHPSKKLRYIILVRAGGTMKGKKSLFPLICMYESLHARMRGAVVLAVVGG